MRLTMLWKDVAEDYTALREVPNFAGASAMHGLRRESQGRAGQDSLASTRATLQGWWGARWTVRPHFNMVKRDLG